MKTGFIVCVSLILTGALGNIIDSVFYGVLFNESTYSQLATLCPKAADTLRVLRQSGRYVLFPIIETTGLNGVTVHRWKPFIFFSPIFNFADAAISCGIIAALLLFYSKYLNDSYHVIKYERNRERKNGFNGIA